MIRIRKHRTKRVSKLQLVLMVLRELWLLLWMTKEYLQQLEVKKEVQTNNLESKRILMCLIHSHARWRLWKWERTKLWMCQFCSCHLNLVFTNASLFSLMKMLVNFNTPSLAKLNYLRSWIHSLRIATLRRPSLSRSFSTSRTTSLNKLETK